MNFIQSLILLMIFYFTVIHARDLHQSKLSEQSDRQNPVRRDIASNNIIASNVKVKRTDSNFLPEEPEPVLRRFIRDTIVLLNITCGTDADCLHLFSNGKCIRFNSITIGVCVPAPVNGAAPSMINGRNTILVFILAILALIIR